MNFCYQLLLLKFAIFLRPRADLGVPPHFSGSDGQKHGNSKIFQRWLLETGALTGKSDDFRRLALTKCAVYIRPRVDLGVLLLLLVGGDGGGGGGAVVVGVVVVVREREKQRERERERERGRESLSPLWEPGCHPGDLVGA